MAIYVILFILLIVIITNLFYRKTAASLWEDMFHINTDSRHSFYLDDESTSENYNIFTVGGYKCKDPFCDCAKHHLEKITILDDQEEHVILYDKKLTSGTHCVPKGSFNCNRKSSTLLFSTLGWSCQSKPLWKNNHRTACKSSKASNNNLNRLEDVLLATPSLPENIDNIYETLSDGTFRYRCKCDSSDLRGNKMIHIIPFKCSQDYCIKDLQNVAPSLGWNHEKKICECGPYPHKDPNDLTSPCSKETGSHYHDGEKKLYGKLECLTRETVNMHTYVYCPSDATKDTLNFTKKISASNDPFEFLKTI